jgi:hypothetical protein
MTPWADYCAQIAAHSARCSMGLTHHVATSPEGGCALLCACRLCWWHAAVVLRPGDYPLDPLPGLAVAAEQEKRDS